MTTAVVTTSSTPSIHSTSPRSSIGVIAGSVLASLFLVGIIVVTLIVLAFVYSGRLKKWKVSRVGEENCYGAQEMLMRPGSSTGTLSVSTSPPPHSPRAALPSYDVVTTTDSSVPYYSHANPTTEASGNGSSSTVVYSETNESMRRVVASHSTDDGLVTSHQPTLPSQYSTMGPTSLQAPQGEKYAELVFESSRAPPMPSLDTLVPPVKYTMVKPSKKPHPKSPRPDPEHSAGSQSAVGPDKHPLDRRITIDMAIQQLQQLTPYWWAVGEAAGMQRAALKEIQAHYKGDAKESFAEVMHQIFIPDHTTWTQLAGLCEGVGFADLATALLDSYTTGVLPVAIEEDEDTLRPPPTKPAPPIPPRGTVQDEDQDLPPSLPPPLSPDDIPPSLPPPLAPEDIPPSPPPPLAPEDVPLSVPPPPLRAEAPPPRPPKASKPPAVPPRH
ncbi:hypothetical protein GBAR_LOCUS4527 [Geodia barretti]|nr:hypothetical protein GBAR_LOCUS4527 [Geodia barretti]